MVAWPSRNRKDGVLIFDIIVNFDENVNEMITSFPTPSAPLTRGYKKRSRTRQLLLEAAVEVLAESGEGFSLREVTARADVSHGTLYNYFRDREELMDAVVLFTTESLAARLQTEVQTADQAVQFAVITARALEESATSPDSMRAVLRLESVQRDVLLRGPLAYLHANLVDGFNAKRFTSEIDDATIDIVMGSLLIAVRRAVDGKTDALYVSHLLQRLLTMLGINGTEARQIAMDAVRVE